MNRGNALALALWLVAPVLAAQEMQPKRETGESVDHVPDLAMCSPDGIAVGGYDVVSYRQPDGPVQGSGDYVAEHDGSTYRFASEANRDEFLEDPERYIPAYNGFCAITLSFGRVTCPEYTNFKIEDDQLLLFEITGFTNGRTLWNSDADTFRQRADDNFDRLLRQQ